LPGLALKSELKRLYPAGALAGHMLGTVNVDNRGIAGIERMLDETGQVEPVQGADGARQPSLTLSLDIGVEHALGTELRAAVLRSGGAGARGFVPAALRGETPAAAALPGAAPERSAVWRGAARADRRAGGAFELGSIFKPVTLAMALEAGTADLDKVYDV